MQFEIDDQQHMLRETLTRFLDERYTIEHRNQVAYTAPYHDRRLWQELCDLGMLHALVPEQQGGLGGQGTDIINVFEILGRHVCPEPFLASLLAMTALEETSDVREQIMSGERIACLALPEAGHSADAKADAKDQWRVTGHWPVVYGAQSAELVLVPATHEGTMGLFAVSSDQAQIVPFGLVDGGGAAQILADDTSAECLVSKADTHLAKAENAGLLALCAEALGVMSVMADMTHEYLKTRKQFGRPIGNFQVLQHRLVDLTIEVEQVRSIVILAADSFGTELAMHHASMAKNLVGRAGKLIAEEAIQMHGGMGMTWDMALSHYAKRLIMIDHQLGDTDVHLARVMSRQDFAAS